MEPNWQAFDLYLFDLDDTLICTRDALRASWTHALQQAPELSHRPPEEWLEVLRALTRQFGTTADWEYWQAFAVEVTRDLLQPHPLAEFLREAHRARYWEELQPAENIVALLQTLQAIPKHTALITNGLLAFQSDKLRGTGLREFFPDKWIFCSDQYDWRQQKPSPHMVQEAMNRFDVPPEKTVFFGNASIDIIAGNLAGVTTVAVAEISNPQQVRLLQPDFELPVWPAQF
jgi:FMN phosphatase YigB (HAD superfamily)